MKFTAIANEIGPKVVGGFAMDKQCFTIQTMTLSELAPMSQKLAREQFTQDADKAWRHYRETGLHATSEEVFAWIDSWGTSNELPKPKCHV